MPLKLVKKTTEPSAAKRMQDARMNVVILGHVDHGKSTLIGRLLHDTDSLPEGKFEQIRRSCERRGMAFEWSFLMDTLQGERDQGVTIDTSHIGFKTALRDYVIIDAPGHKEFLKNMISGAAAGEAALVIVDAVEGVKEQSKRHGYLLNMLGIRQVAVLINKMDAVHYDQATFAAVEKEYRGYLATIGIAPTSVIPVSALKGDHLTVPSPNMQWYKGPSVLQTLDGFTPAAGLGELPLRVPVQDVYKFDERRILVGRIETGALSVGDELLFSPGDQRARVASIEIWGHGPLPMHAAAGECVGITLDEQIFVERGQIASMAETPPMLTNLFRARLFWLGAAPLEKNKRYTLRLCTGTWPVEVKTIEQVINTDAFVPAAHQTADRGSVVQVVLRSRGAIALDDYGMNPHTGRFVLLDDYDICAGGIIDTEGFFDQRTRRGTTKSQNITSVDLRITPQQRMLANGHTGGILWFTGLSGSGKSTLAIELQQRLFAKGYQCYVLDGDNIRGGLNRDLGFAAADRTENIRRVGEVASLFADAGFIVITSFISPYDEDRQRAREAAPEHFNIAYIKADLKTCEERDPKGLYRKARKGDIKEFTGISAPYEIPAHPDLVIDTSQLPVGECVTQLMDYVHKKFVEPAEKAINRWGDDG